MVPVRRRFISASAGAQGYARPIEILSDESRWGNDETLEKRFVVFVMCGLVRVGGDYYLTKYKYFYDACSFGQLAIFRFQVAPVSSLMKSFIPRYK